MSFRYKDYAHGNRRKTLTARSRRIHPPLPAARAAARFHAHSPLRPARQSRQTPEARTGAQRPRSITAAEAPTIWRASPSATSTLPALSRRAHGAHRLHSRSTCTCPARATSRMSSTLAPAASPLRRLRATQRPAARAASALTLHAPSVIFISSTSKPPPTRHQPHACVLPTPSHASRNPARIPPHYKSQSAAL